MDAIAYKVTLIAIAKATRYFIFNGLTNGG
jgi:hypothetical protein